MVLEKNFRKYSHVVVTGGAGFIGSHLCEEYLKQGAAVTAIDNLVTGSFKNIAKLEGTKGFRFIEHDISASMPDVGEFDLMLHFACPASPVDFAKMPLEILKVDSLGTFNSLDAATKAKARYVLASTSEVYGDPLEHPQKESYWGNVNSIGDRSCYDEAKRFGETLCVNFAKQHGVAVKTARPFNNYGPGLKITDGRLIPDFARDILSGRDIVMLSDGTPTRTFCYSADAIQGYMKILVKGAPGEAYNIGTETPEISVAELAEKMIALSRELFGYRGKLERKQSRDKEYLIDNPNRRCPVIEKARSHLGYEPVISLDEGLRRSLIWYSGNRDAEEK